MFEVIHHIRTRVIPVRRAGIVRNFQARTRRPARVWVWLRAGARMGACGGATRPGSGDAGRPVECRQGRARPAGESGRRVRAAAGAGTDAGSGRAAGGCWARGCGGGRVALACLLMVGLGSGGRVRWCGGEVGSFRSALPAVAWLVPVGRVSPTAGGVTQELCAAEFGDRMAEGFQVPYLNGAPRVLASPVALMDCSLETGGISPSGPVAI